MAGVIQMNWLQKTSQTRSIEEMFNALLAGNADINWAIAEFKKIGIAACDELQTLGGVGNMVNNAAGAANALASRLMRELGCGDYPNPPDEGPQQTIQMPNLGDQEQSMSMPSAEIG